jgi:hypothetical protein
MPKQTRRTYYGSEHETHGWRPRSPGASGDVCRGLRGPGTQYGVIDTLRRGETVDVQQCRGSWCYVVKSGPDGWVSANYLNRGRPGGGWNDDNWGRPPHWTPNPPRPPQWNPRPPRPPQWNPRPPRPQPWPGHGGNSGSVCFNGPNGYFCIGN